MGTQSLMEIANGDTVLMVNYSRPQDAYRKADQGTYLADLG